MERAGVPAVALPPSIRLILTPLVKLLVPCPFHVVPATRCTTYNVWLSVGHVHDPEIRSQLVPARGVGAIHSVLAWDCK